MFEQLKTILTNEYQSEIARFDSLKEQITNIEEEMKKDDSEDEYQEKLKELNKRYGVFKRGSKEYKSELNSIQVEYSKKLKEFEQQHTNYTDLRREAALINIYIIQKKLDQLNKANSLEDLRMTEEDAQKMIEEKVNNV